MTSTIAVDTLRQTDYQALASVLQGQRARAFDVVVPARSIKIATDVILAPAGRAAGDVSLALSGVKQPLLTDDGVTDVNGFYVPSGIADEGFAAKLDVEVGYLRRLRRDIPDLYQDTIEKLCRNEPADRKLLLRLFRSDEARDGVLRAVLSDRFGIIDNLDVLLAMLDGMRKAGVTDPVIDADLTERRMVVRVTVPQMAVHAEKLLENYRNPFDGSDVSRGWTPDRLREAAAREGHKVTDKVIFAGFVFTNSEVGSGAFRITPRIVVGLCTNGLQISADALSKTHLGGKLEDDGIIQWSEETQKHNLDLITSRAKDAVSTFLNVEYVTKQVEKLEELAGHRIEKPHEVVPLTSKKLGFTEAQAQEILGHFFSAGQHTTGGIMQALTSVAQTVADGDRALEMEQAAVPAMRLARDFDRQLAAA